MLKCFNDLRDAITGKPMSEAQKKVLSRDFMRHLLEESKAGVPDAEIIQRAQEAFANERIRETQRVHANKMRDAIAISQNEAFMREMGAGNHTRALSLSASATVWDKTGRLSMEQKANGMYNAITPKLWEIQRILGEGWFENKENTRQFLKALYGETEGLSPEILKAAKIWSETAESLRVRANQTGANIGKLKGWDVPHSWDEQLVRGLKKQEYIDFMRDRLDRTKYFDDEGNMLDDAAFDAMLGDVYLTQSTGGKIKGAQPVGAGGVKSRGSQERVLHFKDADSFFEAHELLGRDAMQVTMVRHVQSMTNNIAAMEMFGPSAIRNYQMLMDNAVAADLKELDRIGGITSLAKQGKINKDAWLGKSAFKEFISEHEEVFVGKTARFLQSMRNMQATKLGAALITQMNDFGMVRQHAAIFEASGAEAFLNYAKAGLGDKLYLQNAGVMTDIFLHGMYKDARHLGKVGKSRFVADTTLTFSGLSSNTRNLRTGYGYALQNTFGHQVAKYSDMTKLQKVERELLQGNGVTEEVWKVWQQAETKPSVNGGETILTAQSIMDIPDSKLQPLFPDADLNKIRADAAETLGGVTQSIVDATVFEATARQKAMMSFGTQKGTVGGELVRTMMQFKSFPLMYMDNVIKATMAQGNLYKGFGYVTSMVLMTTMAGAMSTQLKQIAAGRDFMDTNPNNEKGLKFWGKAFLAGGSLGIFGDILFSSEADLMKLMVGPGIGDAMKLSDMLRRGMTGVAGNLDQKGAEDIGGDFIRLARGYLPLTTLWYNRTAIDRLATNHLQEAINPGYLRRQEQRAQRQFGQETWWGATEPIPDDAPEIGSLWKDR